MKIKRIIDQHRRDFTAIFECEGCGETVKRGGYDDANFHNNVIPLIECKSCGQSTKSLGVDYRPQAPRYPEGYVV